MSRRFAWALAAILALAAAVRLWRLDHFSYGLDEIIQASWQNGSWEFFWKSLRFDAFHPPLDYVVGKLVDAAHPPDWGRKLPAVLWGLGSIGAFAALLARRAGEAAGLTGAALLALSPFHVRYSQELRPYALALFLVCLGLLLLDRYLEAPRPGRLAAVFVACLAAAYAMYTAALVVALAAAAMLLEDAFDASPERRRAARRFLAGSPLFIGALWFAYLPWWPVFLEAARRPAMAPRAPLSLARADRVLSYFTFAPDDGHPLGRGGLFFFALAAAGLAIALSRRRSRFLAVWAVGGFVAIEALGQVHPHFDVSRRFVPAGPGWVGLGALAIAAILARPVTRLLGAGVLAAVLVLDARGLAGYFRQGRADWRTLADFLRRHSPPTERVFTENQYSQICVGFYLVGPRWMFDASAGGRAIRSVVSLNGDRGLLRTAWWPGARTWLVLAGAPESTELRRWAGRFPQRTFPLAERSILCRLDPAARDAALAAP